MMPYIFHNLFCAGFLVMKYELETIPIWDAFNKDSECPLCLLEKKNEEQYLNFFLGESVMDSKTRVEVNRLGFCPYHSELLYNGGHKLGLAFMIHTHLLTLRESLGHQAEILTKDSNSENAFSSLCEILRKPVRDCIFCNLLSKSLERYAYTIVYLYRTDGDFKKTLALSKGFCLGHLEVVLKMACHELKARLKQEFIRLVLELELKRLDTLAQELDWFTQKFDYRNADKDWGNSRDALLRVLQKLKGKRFLPKTSPGF